jgi:EAL domain-containing protein (putative c-di-GMP-specific phosphodiesterase class I)
VLVEVTESSVVDARGSRTAALLALRELGVQVGIDDFGTGYSMLAYLDRFPLDFLKVDRSFVARLGQGPRPDALVQAIVSIAHAHGLTVTAEGVETPEQAQALRALGCERGQGWLFGRPAPAPR